MFTFFSTPVGVGVIATTALAVISWVWGLQTAENPADGSRRRFRTLPLMILVAVSCSALFLIFYALAFGATEFLPQTTATEGEAAGAVSPASIRVPPVTVAAGLFGGVLFIAFTVLKYRGHVQADEKLVLEQRTAKLQTAEHLSGRFAQAAEMMGSERAATRMGGVYALAALADEWSEERQQCVNFLCGYLRTPIQRTLKAGDGRAAAVKEDLPAPLPVPRLVVPGREQDTETDSDGLKKYRDRRAVVVSQYRKYAPLDELAVRQAVISSIARGTKRPVGDEDSWSEMAFDLSRCYLPDIDFDGCTFLEDVNFVGATFLGSTYMRRAKFHKKTEFTGSYFVGNAVFAEVNFARDASFRAVHFSRVSDFRDSSFAGDMLFANAQFWRSPKFEGVALGRKAAQDSDRQPLANWLGVTFDESDTACPDLENAIWKNMAFVQSGYRMICEHSHDDRPLGLGGGHSLTRTSLSGPNSHPDQGAADLD